MPKHLLDIKNHDQKNGNSCWACCTRVVNNFYKEQNGKEAREIIESDDLLAGKVGLDVAIMQNIQTALDHATIKCYSGQDDTANLPTFEEIEESIAESKQPLIVCVTPAKKKFTDDITDADGGHYVLIVGVITEAPKKLIVMDPASDAGDLLELGFDSEVYAAPYGRRYWASTYYTEDEL